MRRAPAVSLLFIATAMLLVLVLATDDANGYSKHRIRSTICSVFTGSRCGPAIRVATCETGGTLNPHSKGAAGERGLYQLHPVHFKSNGGFADQRRLYEPLYNIRAAFRLSRGGRDWGPWTCKP